MFVIKITTPTAREMIIINIKDILKTLHRAGRYQ